MVEEEAVEIHESDGVATFALHGSDFGGVET